ncbi:hypothetical protein DL765_005431 [Monosporascus sp. GIB2]|nr:hypothetical protein DL765_005431 [Monosporascus sp. GIB2]
MEKSQFARRRQYGRITPLLAVTIVAYPNGNTNDHTSALKSDPNLGYKIKVVLHDLRNLAKDRAAEQRAQSTTDELYISGPCSTSEEAARVRSAVVGNAPIDSREERRERRLPVDIDGPGAEEAIKSSLANFFEKRRASGDARFCGPPRHGADLRGGFRDPQGGAAG